MLKTHYLGLILLVLILLTTACADTTNLEQALQVTQNEVDVLSTRNAEQIDSAAKEIAALATSSAQEASAASTRSAGALAEARGAAEEAVSAAKATSESISAIATTAALPEANYDTTIYGVIEQLDLSGVSVNWWHNKSGEEEEALKEIIAEFNDSNEFGIVIEAANEGDLEDISEKMSLGFATGDVPTVVVASQEQIAKYQAQQGIVSLDPYFEHPTYGLATDQADLYTAFIQAGRLSQFENQLFGFPLDRSMDLLYYNKDWLTELGYEAPPRTLKEFKEVSCAVESDKVGFALRADGNIVTSYAFASGNDVFDYENNTFIYNTPGTLEYLLAMRELINNQCALLTTERFEDQAAFSTRSSLFAQGSSHDLPFVALNIADSEEPFEWSVAPIPYAGYEPAQAISGTSFAIPETSPEEQLAAWLFIRYFTLPEQQAKWVRASNSFPVRASTELLLESYFEENPAYQTAFGLIKYGRYEPALAGFDEVRLEAGVAYTEILLREEPVAGDEAEVDQGPEAILTSLDDTANTILLQEED